MPIIEENLDSFYEIAQITNQTCQDLKRQLMKNSFKLINSIKNLLYCTKNKKSHQLDCLLLRD